MCKGSLERLSFYSYYFSYRLLKKMEQSENTMNVSTSSITLGSLGCSEYSVYVDHDWKDYKHKLAEMFSKDINKDSLLIIDDPREMQIVEAFDVGCKILVTTQDSTLVDSNSSILKVTTYNSKFDDSLYVK